MKNLQKFDKKLQVQPIWKALAVAHPVKSHKYSDFNHQ